MDEYQPNDNESEDPLLTYNTKEELQDEEDKDGSQGVDNEDAGLEMVEKEDSHKEVVLMELPVENDGVQIDAVENDGVQDANKILDGNQGVQSAAAAPSVDDLGWIMDEQYGYHSGQYNL
ncbi:hypothetical protein ACA910_006762 [Epithemia clementina (nom. ined.)]